MSNKSADYIEDLLDSPIEIESVLTHQELVEGGLVPIQAYARTRSSKAAMRAKRHRERLEAGKEDAPPQKQLNVLAPTSEDARKAIKEVANALVEGRITPADVQGAKSEEIRLGRAVKRVLSRGGVRAAALRMIIGAGLQ